MLDTCLHQHNSHAIDKVMFCLRFKKEHFYIILVVISHGVLSKKYRKENFSDLISIIANASDWCQYQYRQTLTQRHLVFHPASS